MSKKQPPTYDELVLALGSALDLISYLRGDRVIRLPVASKATRLERIWKAGAEKAGLLPKRSENGPPF